VKVLYNQNNDPADDGLSVLSQNFGKGNSDNSQAADDFTVPKGHTWTITKVTVAGSYYSSGVSAPSENVFFYKNKVNAKKQDVPGVQVKKVTLKGKDTSGSFVISGIKGVALAAGHYWVSVQANLAAASGQQWEWEGRAVQSGSPAVWRNLGNGFGTGCTAWTSPVAPCGGLYGSTTG
jgi:hypothetical protein